MGGVSFGMILRIRIPNAGLWPRSQRLAEPGLGGVVSDASATGKGLTPPIAPLPQESLSIMSLPKANP